MIEKRLGHKVTQEDIDQVLDTLTDGMLQTTAQISKAFAYTLAIQLGSHLGMCLASDPDMKKFDTSAVVYTAHRAIEVFGAGVFDEREHMIARELFARAASIGHMAELVDGYVQTGGREIPESEKN